MKRLLIALLCLSGLTAFSQLSLAKLDATPINDGDVFVFDNAEEPGSYLGIKAFNNSDEDINVRVKCLGITNANGSNVQLCFGNVCVFSVTSGNSYPSIPAVIEAHSSNGDFDHFMNLNTGIDTNAIVQYSFKFYQVNNSGVEIGNSISFSYVYNPTLAVKDFSALQNIGVTLQSNVADRTLDITTLKNLQYEIFDLSGKLIDRQKLAVGTSAIEVSNLNTGVYLINFTNDQKQTAVTRFVKK